MEEPQRYWRNAEPKDAYEVVIVGGGGHGLATAYYLAKNHGITDVCIVEKGWLAGGNVARNTTVIRSNYLWDESRRDLRALAGSSGRGSKRTSPGTCSSTSAACSTSCTTSARSANSIRRVDANRLKGIDAERLDAEQVKEFCPIVNISPDVRYPVIGGDAATPRRHRPPRQGRVGVARAASELGVDIVEHAR